MAVNDRAAEPALPADNDVGPVPVTVGSIDHSNVQWRAMTRARAARRADHRRDRPVRRSVDGARADLRAGRHRVRGAAGARRRRVLRSCIAACAHWSRSSRPLPRSPPDELDRRVPERDPRTEVGRLSLALNGMLAQIQRAVASSESSAEAGPHLRGPDAPVHHRRQPRAAHAADHDPRLRRAVPAGRGQRRRDADEPHRERVPPDGSARRGPAAAGPARRAAAAGAAPRRPARARQRRRARRAVDRAAQTQDHHGGVRRAGHPGGARRRGPAAAGARQPGRQRAAAHPRHRRHHGAGRHRRRTTPCSRCATRAPA